MTNSTPQNLTGAVADELTALKAVKRDVTNQTLADALGLSTRQVIRLLQGKADISLRQVELFALALGTTQKAVIEAAYLRLGE